MDNSFVNIGTNVIAPVDWNVQSLIPGTMTVIASEVLFEYIIRMFMKARKPVLDLVYIHALSTPFLGGLQFTKPSMRISQVSEDGKANGYFEQIMSGAKGIPAVILAQYVVSSFTSGFHVPWFNLKDILITAAAKAVTAPLLFALSESMPESLADGLDVMQQLVELQAASSVFVAKDKRGVKKATANSLVSIGAAGRKSAWEAAKK